MSLRVGQGWDIHRLVSGRALVLGGLRIESELGELGHSDGDVLFHAITDAILGAVAAGDIGRHFPPSDPRWKGAESRLFAERAAAIAYDSGWRLVNVDSTVLLERPRLGPHIDGIRASIASALGLPIGSVSVKAKTREGLGDVGRLESIEAQAVVLVESLGGSASARDPASAIEYRKLGKADVGAAKELIGEYVRSLPADISYQGVHGELASFPAKYAEPDGAFIVAADGPALAGCVGLRRLPDGLCEMKRLFVRDAYKGRGIGRALASAIIGEAAAKGYRAIRLDTLASMEAAVGLYRSLGFVEIGRYIDNPLPGAMFMERRLDGPPAGPSPSTAS